MEFKIKVYFLVQIFLTNVHIICNLWSVCLSLLLKNTSNSHVLCIILAFINERLQKLFLKILFTTDLKFHNLVYLSNCLLCLFWSKYYVCQIWFFLVVIKDRCIIFFMLFSIYSLILFPQTYVNELCFLWMISSLLIKIS